MANVSYFKGVQTLEDIRVKLIENLKELDSDSGKFQTMMEQYNKAWLKVGENHKSRKGKIYAKRIDSISPKDFASMMQRILAMDGVEIKNEGTWFWVSGNTEAHKKELGAINREILKGKGTMRYSGKRQAWWYEDRLTA